MFVFFSPDFSLNTFAFLFKAKRKPGVETVVEGIGALVAADGSVQDGGQMRDLIGQPVLTADLQIIFRRVLILFF